MLKGPITLIFLALYFLSATNLANAKNPLERPNNFTLQKKVPHGCLDGTPTFDFFLQPSKWEMLTEDVIAVEDAQGDTANLQIRTWRIACQEPDRSAIIVNFDIIDGPINQLKMPFLDIYSMSAEEWVPAQLSMFTGGTFESIYPDRPLLAELTQIEDEGVSYILDTVFSEFSQDDYNDVVSLHLDFQRFQTLQIEIPAFDPARDRKETRTQDFNGRHTGQWTAEGLPSSGLVLQVGEVPGYRNFIFAIWFTYLDGSPLWLVGNTDPSTALGSEIILDMFLVEGGELITEPGTFSQDDIESTFFGTMTLRTVHCNQLEADIDFRPNGFGLQNGLMLDRLVRVAGYDCDQTQ